MTRHPYMFNMSISSDVQLVDSGCTTFGCGDSHTVFGRCMAGSTSVAHASAFALDG